MPHTFLLNGAISFPPYLQAGESPLADVLRLIFHYIRSYLYLETMQP
jgi:hypothetical protein